MTTSAERVAMCDQCIYGKNVHWFGDFHEYCDAEHCVICFQTGKLGDECEDFTPRRIKMDDKFRDVIESGRNIKMQNFTGCGIDENWTLDDCENKCPKYYSCYAVALADDVLKEYEENKYGEV